MIVADFRINKYISYAKIVQIEYNQVLLELLICRQSYAKINYFYHVLFFFVYNVCNKGKIYINGTIKIFQYPIIYILL